MKKNNNLNHNQSSKKSHQLNNQKWSKNNQRKRLLRLHMFKRNSLWLISQWL